MILVTGGAGYIGSHTCIELLQEGYETIVFDNFCNSSQESLKRVEQITGKSLTFIDGDVRCKETLKKVFETYPISAVIHFAGLKAVGESTQIPLEYYDNNVSGSLNLLQVMAEYDCKSFVFSSSATVYGDPATVPINESFPLQATNPYGRSKLIVEDFLRDLYASDNSWQIAILRYFNPVGAHHSGLIGEDPTGIPNNLMPFIAQVAVGRRDKLKVFGSDYDTNDGTGVRDYIHVTDLARGHTKALAALTEPQLLTVNLGTGTGYSVLDMVEAFGKACGKTIPHELVDRRPGDIATCFADPQLALEKLGWKAEFGVEQMCQDTWHWQSKNPKGYDS